MTASHIWDELREVCVACGRPRQEIFERHVEGALVCDGKVEYRESIYVGPGGPVIVKVPIIPARAYARH